MVRRQVVGAALPSGAALYFSAGGHRKDTLMVCRTSPAFGGVVPIDNFRPLFAQAHDRLLAKDTIGCGVILREGIRRMLRAACEYHNCLPDKKGQMSPAALSRALKKAGVLDCRWVGEIVDVGNKCAHYQIVDWHELNGAIELAYAISDYVRTEGTIGGLREGGAV